MFAGETASLTEIARRWANWSRGLALSWWEIGLCWCCTGEVCEADDADHPHKQQTPCARDSGSSEEQQEQQAPLPALQRTLVPTAITLYDTVLTI